MRPRATGAVFIFSAPASARADPRLLGRFTVERAALVAPDVPARHSCVGLQPYRILLGRDDRGHGPGLDGLGGGDEDAGEAALATDLSPHAGPGEYGHVVIAIICPRSRARGSLGVREAVENDEAALIGSEQRGIVAPDIPVPDRGCARLTVLRAPRKMRQSPAHRVAEAAHAIFAHDKAFSAGQTSADHREKRDGQRGSGGAAPLRLCWSGNGRVLPWDAPGTCDHGDNANCYDARGPNIGPLGSLSRMMTGDARGCLIAMAWVQRTGQIASVTRIVSVGSMMGRRFAFLGAGSGRRSESIDVGRQDRLGPVPKHP